MERRGDLTDLYGNSAGDERMGGAGDEDPMAFIRRGRYIIYIEVQDGYGPVGALMYAEDGHVRQNG